MHMRVKLFAAAMLNIVAAVALWATVVSLTTNFAHLLSAVAFTVGALFALIGQVPRLLGKHQNPRNVQDACLWVSCAIFIAGVLLALGATLVDAVQGGLFYRWP